jgi:hypothetical protein
MITIQGITPSTQTKNLLQPFTTTSSNKNWFRCSPEAFICSLISGKEHGQSGKWNFPFPKKLAYFLSFMPPRILIN